MSDDKQAAGGTIVVMGLLIILCVLLSMVPAAVLRKHKELDRWQPLLKGLMALGWAGMLLILIVVMSSIL